MPETTTDTGASPPSAPPQSNADSGSGQILVYQTRDPDRNDLRLGFLAGWPNFRRYVLANRFINDVNAAEKYARYANGRELRLSAEDTKKLIESYKFSMTWGNQYGNWVLLGTLGFLLIRRSMRISTTKRLYDEAAYWQGRAQGHEVGLKLYARRGFFHQSPLLHRDGRLSSTLDKNRGIGTAFEPSTRVSDDRLVVPSGKNVAAEGCTPSGRFYPPKDASQLRKDLPMHVFQDKLALYSTTLANKVRRGASALREGEQDAERDESGRQAEGKKKADGE